MSAYKQWVNEDRTVLVTMWNPGQNDELVTVATREQTWYSWGPPIHVKPEHTTNG